MAYFYFGANFIDQRCKCGPNALPSLRLTPRVRELEQSTEARQRFAVIISLRTYNNNNNNNRVERRAGSVACE